MLPDSPRCFQVFVNAMDAGKAYFQHLYVMAPTLDGAVAATTAYLRSIGSSIIEVDREDSGIVDAADIGPELRLPLGDNVFGVFAKTGRIFHPGAA